MTSRFGSLALVALVTLACSGTPGDAPRSETVDSAGVRIVRHDLVDVTLPVYRTLGPADLEIGVVDGDAAYSFSRIVDLGVTDDDRLVVSDANARELRVFDVEGRHAGTIGGAGEGPGEFATAPTVVGMAGDTVFAFDPRSGRVSLFLLDGRFVESVTVRSGGGNRVSALHRRDDGDLLAVSGWARPDGGVELHDVRMELDSVVIELMGPKGRVLDTLKVAADRNRLRMVQDRGGGMIRSIQAVPPFLPYFHLVSNGLVDVMGSSDSFGLEVWSPGAPITRLRVSGADNPAGRGDMRTFQEAEVRADLGDAPLDPLTRRVLFDHIPERLPSFAGIVITRDGDIWVRKSTVDEAAEGDWIVFSAAGGLRGTVRTPAGLRLLAVRPNYIVGVARDDLDVPYVRRFPLER